MRTLLPVVLGIACRVEPLQPTPGPPFHRPGWVYEEKYDGWRMVAYKSGQQVRLISRHGRDHTTRFRAIAEAIAGLPAPTLVLDGEVAAFDQHLVSHFPLLRPSTPSAVVTPPILVAFDCLYARGQDFRAHPLSVRRLVLEQEIAGQDVVLLARRLATNGLQAWKEVQRRGSEIP